MPYLIFTNEGKIQATRIQEKDIAEICVRLYAPGGGYFYYTEDSETTNYWYPGGVKTALDEFHLTEYNKNLSLINGDVLEITGLPEDTEVILKNSWIGKIGPVGIMRWTPMAAGMYFFTFQKIGYKDKMIRIDVGLTSIERESFTVDFS